jgi:hypothetical protein
MRLRRYIEEIPRMELDHAILERDGGYSLQDQPHVLDRTSLGSDSRADMFGPLPAGLIGCAPNRETGESHQLEPPQHHVPHFVWLLKTFEDQLNHLDTSPSGSGLWLSSYRMSHYLVRQGQQVDLKEIDPDDTQELPGGKVEAKTRNAKIQVRLGELQELLYAEHKKASDRPAGDGYIG